jgi:RHS repeat-associated protein
MSYARRIRSVLLAGGVSAALVIALAGPGTGAPRTSPGQQARPSDPQRTESVPGRNATSESTRPTDLVETVPARAVSWPSGRERMRVAGGANATDASADRLPIRVSAADGATRRVPARVSVTVPDRGATASAGVEGLVLTVDGRESGTATSSVRVTVDYSGFAHAYGGDWAARLRFVPIAGEGQAEYGRGQDDDNLVSRQRNDVAAQRIAADLDLTGGTGTFAVTAAAEGSTGDFKATSLSPAGTWSVAEQSGSFAWSYEMPAPPVPGGLEPEVGLGYSSQSVDGRTVSSNNQTSWVGEGWGLGAGYIERTYKPCQDDLGGNNGATKTGDLCWEIDNATMSFGDQSGELVLQGGVWRPANDDGTKVERLTGAANGDNDGEHWRVTTTDGTQYYFGRRVDSAWNVPVYGNDPAVGGTPAEPCHAATFATSACSQTYRWNLDYVVDRNGNTMTYQYVREENKYAQNMGRATGTYTRGGYLARINYGTHMDVSGGVPARVVFTVADRCVPGQTCTTRTSASWPDVPWDRECATSSCGTKYSPTFWSTKRLASVTTQVATALTENPVVYRDVDRWDLTHSWPNPGDGTTASMWLARVNHKGISGASSVAAPTVTFMGSFMANRVNSATDGLPKLNKLRVTAIHNGAGGTTNVQYSTPECADGATPAPNEMNTKRCYPVKWAMPPATQPVNDWFHKYVVTRVAEDDRVGGSKDLVTSYEYAGGAGWAYTDHPLVPADKRTWSQWRGYERVSVRTGDKASEPASPQSLTTYLYFRGLHGDKKQSGGTRDEDVVDSTGTSLDDARELAGFLREEITYNGVGGAEVGGSIHTPWSRKTAEQGTLRAHQVESVDTAERTRLVDGTYRRTRVETTHDAYGNATLVEDHGDLAVPSDDQCTRTTYATNATTWLMTLPRRTTTVAVGCGVAPQLPADHIEDTRFLYDGLGADVQPTRGNVTSTQVAHMFREGVPVHLERSSMSYDRYGRAVQTTDSLGRRTTTSYTQTHGLTTASTSTNPLGHTHVTTLEPGRGLVLTETDGAGRVTAMRHDALGRLTEVWTPGRAPEQDAPTLRYTYQVRDTAPSSIRTDRIAPHGNHVTSYTLLDGLLRARQTQAPSPQGGRVLTDVLHDSRGLVALTRSPYYNSGAPGTTLFLPDAGAVPRATTTVYDGAQRETASVHLELNVEKWRTRTYHGGDHTSVVPPAGGITTRAWTDARGNTTRLEQFHTRPTSGAPSGPADETRYTYTDSGDLASLTDPAGNVWRYEYDLLGRQVVAHDPDRGTSTMTYDHADQLTSVTDARGRTVASVHDALGRTVETRAGTTSGTLLTRMTYDTLAKGSLTSSTSIVDGHEYTRAVTGFDAAGRPTGTSLTVPTAEPGDEAVAGTYSTSTTYAVDGSPTSVELPELGDLPAETYSYSYTELGNLARLGGDRALVSDIVYTALGEPARVQLGAPGARVWQSTYYDEGTRRVAKSIIERERAGSVQAADRRYAYDSVGNVTQVLDDTTGSTTDRQCFTYDHLRRTTAAWTASADCAATPSPSSVGGPAPYWHTYGYDKAGNRTSLDRHGIGGAPITPSRYSFRAQAHALTTAATGDRTESFAYDPAGNLTARTGVGADQAFTWNDQGQLTRITTARGSTTYVHDANGAQLLRRDPDTITLFLGGAELRLDRATGDTIGTRYHGGYATQDADGLTWTASDLQGTSTLAIDGESLEVTTRRLDPFGNARGAQAPWAGGHRGFVGGEMNESTGLTRLGAREYDPVLGRFISVDPIIDHADPQQLNPYAYSNNNPASMSDPTGLRYSCPDGDCGGQRGPNGRNVGKKKVPAKAPGTAYNKSYSKPGPKLGPPSNNGCATFTPWSECRRQIAQRNAVRGPLSRRIRNDEALHQQRVRDQREAWRDVPPGFRNNDRIARQVANATGTAPVVTFATCFDMTGARVVVVGIGLCFPNGGGEPTFEFKIGAGFAWGHSIGVQQKVKIADPYRANPLGITPYSEGGGGRKRWGGTGELSGFTPHHHHYPDFTATGSYGVSSGFNFGSGGITGSVPLSKMSIVSTSTLAEFSAWLVS